MVIRRDGAGDLRGREEGAGGHVAADAACRGLVLRESDAWGEVTALFQHQHGGIDLFDPIKDTMLPRTPLEAETVQILMLCQSW